MYAMYIWRDEQIAEPSIGRCGEMNIAVVKQCHATKGDLKQKNGERRDAQE